MEGHEEDGESSGEGGQESALYEEGREDIAVNEQGGARGEECVEGHEEGGESSGEGGQECALYEEGREDIAVNEQGGARGEECVEGHEEGGESSREGGQECALYEEGREDIAVNEQGGAKGDEGGAPERGNPPPPPKSGLATLPTTPSPLFGSLAREVSDLAVSLNITGVGAQW